MNGNQKLFSTVVEEMDAFVIENGQDYETKTVLDTHLLKAKLIEWLAVLQGVASTKRESVVLSSRN